MLPNKNEFITKINKITIEVEHRQKMKKYVLES